jgi:phosphopentomutase
MIFGHRNDVEGYASALEYFDSKLQEIISLMKEEDILFITADHGCDPTTDSTDHSREYVPVLVYGSKVKANTDLGIRRTFADLGQTISDYLGLGAEFEAESFLQDILK